MVNCSEKLPTEKFYEKLNKYESSSELCETYIDNIDPAYRSYENFIKLCGMLVKFLSDKHSKDKKSETRCNRCYLLNYWIYEKLNNIPNYQSEKKLVLFANLKLIWDKVLESLEYPKENRCELDPRIFLDTGWEAKKAFYESCENYKEIKLRSKSKKSQCHTYRNYFEEKLSKYSNLDKSSLEEKIKECSKRYKRSINCNQQIDFTALIDNEKVSIVANPKQSVEEKSFLSKIQAILTQPGGLQRLSSPQTLIKLIDNIRGSNNSQSTTLSTRLITISCSVLGILFLLYFWYKFTPYGAVIRIIVRKIKRYRYKRRQKKSEKLLADKLKSKENNSHYISYSAE
ncbi:PIR protein [Plasmodium ovale]|uniref:PIR protein n=1 Tax=Plasmodium ovale TaxID=36330 RepID=A0A1C3KIW7_PLAOA|nr:PIR protein [Plasmodium ovale]